MRTDIATMQSAICSKNLNIAFTDYNYPLVLGVLETNKLITMT